MSSLKSSSRKKVEDSVFNPVTGQQVEKKKWDDWHWQMSNRITTIEGLQRSLGISEEVVSQIELAADEFPFAITPYYASLIKETNENDPVYAQCVPQDQELCNPSFLSNDPLGEEADSPVPHLVHRYRDRALLVSTTSCSAYCRHCTRKRVAGQSECFIKADELEVIRQYLSSHPEIKDVIISGGDPFTMATSRLEKIVSMVRSVESVEIIRIGTRTPVVMPQRIDEELVGMLSKYHPIFVNTHFNHPNEVTEEAIKACQKMVNVGILVGNQTVLLRGVNDDPLIMEELFRKLIKNRIRPQYLFQCDLVKGVEHFRTPIATGLAIMEHLRGRLSGIAIPTFVVDAPDGGGKIPLLPQYVVSSSEEETVLRNYKGMIVSYPEPVMGKVMEMA
jgi:lysine 2,3-aminomutase